MIFHVDPQYFIEKIFKIIIAKAFEKFLYILSNWKFESPFLVSQDSLQHWNEVFESVLFSNNSMQIRNILNNIDSYH